jgi:hypothetical protein
VEPSVLQVTTDNHTVAAIALAWEMTKYSLLHTGLEATGENMREEFERNFAAIVTAAASYPKRQASVKAG